MSRPLPSGLPESTVSNHDFYPDYPLKKGGLDFFIAQGGANLSGGQKQRLSVARALVRKPEILILDDSSSALDFATEARMRDAIYSLDYNPTVFIVSQRASSFMSADKIIVLDDGKCVGIGTHKELLIPVRYTRKFMYLYLERRKLNG